jgi:hypothetical protein
VARVHERVAFVRVRALPRLLDTELRLDLSVVQQTSEYDIV